jgi:adenine-specific DNA-methyltransferase
VNLEQYLEQQGAVIRELYRVLAPSGSICWQVGNYVENGEIFPLDIYYYPIFKRLGMFLRNRIVWHFGHGLHASNRFSGRYETLLWFTKTDEYVFNLDAVRIPSKYPGKRHYKGAKKGQISGNPKGKNPSDVWKLAAEEWETALWDIPNVKANHAEKTIHPAQFPIELAERCILAASNEDDWVLDPYVGVGTTILAALRRGRRAIGAEQMDEYVAIAKERIQDWYNGTLSYRPLGKPVHKPSGKEKVAQVPEEWLEESTTYRMELGLEDSE